VLAPLAIACPSNREISPSSTEGSGSSSTFFRTSSPRSTSSRRDSRTSVARAHPAAYGTHRSQRQGPPDHRGAFDLQYRLPSQDSPLTSPFSLKSTKQRVVFSDAEDWIFASPIRLGRLPYSYTCVCCEVERAANAAKVGHLGTHTFRHTYRSWLDAVCTPIAMQQKMMRHSDIRTTMNILCDVVTDERSLNWRFRVTERDQSAKAS
jgi:hypothetical protein